MTTFLTIDSSGTRGNSGEDRFGKHGNLSRKHQKRTEKIRKKFHQFFGTRMPRVRVSPLGPKIQILLLRNLDFCFVWGVTRTVQCNRPVDSCWSPAGRRPLHNSHSPGNENVTSLATRTKAADFFAESAAFSFVILCCDMPNS